MIGSEDELDALWGKIKNLFGRRSVEDSPQTAGTKALGPYRTLVPKDDLAPAPQYQGPKGRIQAAVVTNHMKQCDYCKRKIGSQPVHWCSVPVAWCSSPGMKA